MGERSGDRSPSIDRFLSSFWHLGASSAIDRWQGCDRSQVQKSSELVSDLHQLPFTIFFLLTFLFSHMCLPFFNILIFIFPL
jgi:hypothetical protein